MNIVLLYGGISGEHEISLLSAASVLRAVAKEHQVQLIFINKKGEWFLQSQEATKQARRTSGSAVPTETDEASLVHLIPGGKSGKNGSRGSLFAKGNIILADVVFPVLHGTYGEDGTVQGLLEMLNVAYVGCGVFSSSATMDKLQTKRLWEHAGLPVVPYRYLTRSDINDSHRYDALLQEATEALGFPLFVKPCSAGSSDGASKANNARELSFAIMEAFQWDNKVLIEKAIDAREVECSVTGNSVTGFAEDPYTKIKAYGPGEIVPKHEFYDYDAKYNDPDGAELKIPAILEADRLEEIRAIAKKAYTAVEASGLSRVDFFIDRASGALYLNEINTIPGFTDISMFPKMCESAGLSFTDLLELLFAEALARYESQKSLCTSRT